MACRHYDSRGAYLEFEQWFIECDNVRRYFNTEQARNDHIKACCKGDYSKCDICQGRTQQPGRKVG